MRSAMKIGLVRHFKVNLHSRQGWITGEQFNDWMDQYNKADIRQARFENYGHVWDKCQCSNLSRAVNTAQTIYAQDIEFTSQLREVEFSAVKRNGIRLPVNLWLAWAHFAWLMGHHSQPEQKQSVIRRANEFIDTLEDGQNEPASVLIVSHGGFMRLLSRELRHRKYKGKRIVHPRNGELYVYRK